jgi:hypothetical protein
MKLHNNQRLNFIRAGYGKCLQEAEAMRERSDVLMLVLVARSWPPGSSPRLSYCNTT